MCYIVEMQKREEPEMSENIYEIKIYFCMIIIDSYK